MFTMGRPEAIWSCPFQWKIQIDPIGYSLLFENIGADVAEVTMASFAVKKQHEVLEQIGKRLTSGVIAHTVDALCAV